MASVKKSDCNGNLICGFYIPFWCEMSNSEAFWFIKWHGYQLNLFGICFFPRCQHHLNISLSFHFWPFWELSVSGSGKKWLFGLPRASPKFMTEPSIISLQWSPAAGSLGTVVVASKSRERLLGPGLEFLWWAPFVSFLLLPLIS